MYFVKKVRREKNVEDRVERCRLNSQLALIEKEKKSELKMHDSETRRIKSRFSKAGFNADSFSEVNFPFIHAKTADVRMYETHNPGFCYRRNGKPKIASSNSSMPIIDFQQIKNLIFTNDDLDIEKLLCLHILSAHKTEMIVMPNFKYFRDSPKLNTPMERLIQRSKKVNKEKEVHNEILNLLPVYVITVDVEKSCTAISSISNKEENEEQLFRDARISSRLIINNKIQAILVSVLTSLETSNIEKFKEIVEKSQDILLLKKMFNKPNIQDFLKMLNDTSLLTSCESYILTPKIKKEPIYLDVRTIYGNLESLILQIRTYLFQTPSKSAAAKYERRTLYELEEEIIDDNFISSTSNHFVIGKGEIYRNKSSRSINSSSQMKKSQVLEKNFYFWERRNLINIGKEKSMKKLLNVEDNLKTNRMTSEFKAKEVQESEDIKLDESEKEIEDKIPNKTSFIKKTSCIACQEKWKLELPSPKIPNYTRKQKNEIVEMKKISSMINEELFRLKSYDNKQHFMDRSKITYLINNNNCCKTENLVSTISDFLEISPFDLARVSHEIADKENEKKLDFFLKTAI